MRSRLSVLIIAFLTGGLAAFAQAIRPDSFTPALYTSQAARHELKVFPLVGEAHSIPLPLALGSLSFSPDGKALYGDRLFDATMLLQQDPSKNGGLFKVEFDPIRVSLLPGSDRVFPVYSLAVSPLKDQVIALGFEPGGKKGMSTLLELNLKNGSIRTVIESFAPMADPTIYIANLSLSPDALRATATRNRRVEVIDLTNGSISYLEEGIESAEWSPDGKWLAVDKGGTTMRLDSSTLKPRRVLGATLLKWSPDSRYLLNRKSNLMCGLGEVGTLEMVDVQTGGRTEVGSSKCLVDRNTLGWLSNAVVNHPGR
jgi:WD40 repeat protein